MAYGDVLNEKNVINGIPFERVIEGDTIDDTVINPKNIINGIPFERVVHERRIVAGAVFCTKHIDE